MPFQPHPAQLQALRTAKRFKEGIHPTKIGSEIGLGCVIRFETVPSQVMQAEIGHLCASGGSRELLQDLCNRGYLRKYDRYREFTGAPIEYQTEDGASVLVHDSNWTQIEVRRPGAIAPDGQQFVRHYAWAPGSGAKKAQSPSKQKRANGTRAGCSFQLLPDGYKLLDEMDARTALEDSNRNRGENRPKNSKPRGPAWARLELRRSSDGSDHHAQLDGKIIRIRGEAAFRLLDVLQEKRGERVKAGVLQIEIRQRPDRVLNRLDKRLQRIIDRPKKGGVGYAML
ncbi:MAG: hypothetical protein J5J06_09335 [Phycisphaerae bacterium]|nr:hypothetical protein [Phycisphaerae bacterium]